MADAETTATAAAPLTFEEKVAKSSQVQTITYDPDKQIMSVVFKNQKNAAEPPRYRYDYQGFPPEKWAELQAADSIGSYLYRNVTRPQPGEVQPPYQFIKADLAAA